MTDDFRDDPAFLRDEVIAQAALATGAMREADGWKRLADDNGAEAMRRGKEVVALREQLAGAVSREHAAQAIGWLSAEVAVHGAPSLGPEWLDLWDRALAATGEL
jgi:hypothetical protein